MTAARAGPNEVATVVAPIAADAETAIPASDEVRLRA
jgi:hypothetical protein